MIISRTPFRISFFGGGTDYPAWYRKYGGNVLSTSINKYCYLTCRFLPPFFEHRIRVVYSKIENCRTFDEIKHPAARETLRFLNLQRGVEIHHDGDLPARSGMGSSSAFTVGLLNSLYGLQGILPGKRKLALDAIHIEQDLIGETVGSQDQVASAFGGFNHISFHPDGEIVVRPITLLPQRRKELDSHLMLFYTGLMRTASTVAATYVADVEQRKTVLQTMSGMVERAIDLLSGNECICKFGEMMHEGWLAKKSLSGAVSNEIVDDLYSRARKTGALGGKIIGAGGGGFLLLFAPPSAHGRIQSELRELIHVPFEFESSGSQIIFFDPSQEDFSHLEQTQDRRALFPFRELSSVSAQDKPS
jgi:D-glycero-alpha-D-manno-heptose-7-phosphate kinase